MLKGNFNRCKLPYYITSYFISMSSWKPDIVLDLMEAVLKKVLQIFCGIDTNCSFLSWKCPPQPFQYGASYKASQSVSLQPRFNLTNPCLVAVWAHFSERLISCHKSIEFPLHCKLCVEMFAIFPNLNESQCEHLLCYHRSNKLPKLTPSIRINGYLWPFLNIHKMKIYLINRANLSLLEKSWFSQKR